MLQRQASWWNGFRATLPNGLSDYKAGKVFTVLGYWLKPPGAGIGAEPIMAIRSSAFECL